MQAQSAVIAADPGLCAGVVMARHIGYGPAPMPKFSREEVRALYDQPLLPLLDEARRVHLAHHPDNEVQLCTLLSV